MSFLGNLFSDPTQPLQDFKPPDVDAGGLTAKFKGNAYRVIASPDLREKALESAQEQSRTRRVDASLNNTTKTITSIIGEARKAGAPPKKIRALITNFSNMKRIIRALTRRMMPFDCDSSELGTSRAKSWTKSRRRFCRAGIHRIITEGTDLCLFYHP